MYRIFDFEDPSNYLGFSLEETKAIKMADRAATNHFAGQIYVLRIPLETLKLECEEGHMIVYKTNES